MENQLQPISSLQPASFAKGMDKLSPGQERILKLLTKRIKDNTPITIEDIVDCYFDTVSVEGTVRVRGNLNYGTFYCNELPKEHPQLRPKAIQWFKMNIGSCIMKARLLVIPIIEI